MSNTSVRAPAEGMPNVNRRNALALAGSGVAAALATLALPTRAVAAAEEAPVTRVNRLAFELSGAMDDWMADLGVDGVPDLWKAHVYPASQSAYPVGFEHLGRGAGGSKVAELETAFHAEWQKHREMLPEHNAAEKLYFKERSKLVKPVMRETTQEEIDAVSKLTIGELREWKSPTSATRGYNDALRAYNKAEWEVRRRTGYTKIDRAFMRQLDRAHAAANGVLRCPAQSFGDIAAKARVHRVWEFDGDDINYIMADIARVAGKGGAV